MANQTHPVLYIYRDLEPVLDIAYRQTLRSRILKLVKDFFAPTWFIGLSYTFIIILLCFTVIVRKTCDWSEQRLVFLGLVNIFSWLVHIFIIEVYVLRKSTHKSEKIYSYSFQLAQDFLGYADTSLNRQHNPNIAKSEIDRIRTQLRENYTTFDLDLAILLLERQQQLAQRNQNLADKIFPAILGVILILTIDQTQYRIVVQLFSILMFGFLNSYLGRSSTYNGVDYSIVLLKEAKLAISSK